MRHHLFLFAKLLLIFGLISCNRLYRDNTEGGNAEETYLVGMNLTLTGNAAHYGAQLKDGLEFGFEMSTDLPQGGGVKLIVEDNQLNTREAVSIAKRLADIDKIDLMISAYTPVVKSIIDIAEQKELPFLATITSAVDVARGKKWVFRDFTTEAYNMPLLAEHAYNVEGYRKGTYLVVNDDFGRDARRYFELSFTGLGGAFLGGEFFETTDLDLRNKVEKIMASEPEFILLIGRGSAMMNACRQIREVDREIRIYSAAGIDNYRVWQGLGPDANGIIFARIRYDSSSEEYLNINNDFKSRFGYDMSWVSIYGYSIARYVTIGFNKAGKDKDKMREYLKNLDYQSIRGRLTTKENSDIITPMQLYIRKDGMEHIVN
jgi:ABC-type branched-subunit amino acid transport system substrate-binding protein